jgi:hypothetical protein
VEPVKIPAHGGFIFLRLFNYLKIISPPPSPSPIKGEDLSWWIAPITPSPLAGEGRGEGEFLITK